MRHCVPTGWSVRVVVVWSVGVVVGRSSVGVVVGWSVGVVVVVVGWSVDGLVGKLDSFVVGHLACWLVSWSSGCLISWCKSSGWWSVVRFVSLSVGVRVVVGGVGRSQCFVCSFKALHMGCRGATRGRHRTMPACSGGG